MIWGKGGREGGEEAALEKGVGIRRWGEVEKIRMYWRKMWGRGGREDRCCTGERYGDKEVGRDGDNQGGRERWR